MAYVAVEEKCPACAGDGFHYIASPVPGFPVYEIGCNRCLGTGWLEVYRHADPEAAPSNLEVPDPAHAPLVGRGPQPDGVPDGEDESPLPVSRGHAAECSS